MACPGSDVGGLWLSKAGLSLLDLYLRDAAIAATTIATRRAGSTPIWYRRVPAVALRTLSKTP
jgi:hypothetical protein